MFFFWLVGEAIYSNKLEIVSDNNNNWMLAFLADREYVHPDQIKVRPTNFPLLKLFLKPRGTYLDPSVFRVAPVDPWVMPQFLFLVDPRTTEHLFVFWGSLVGFWLGFVVPSRLTSSLTPPSGAMFFFAC